MSVSRGRLSRYAAPAQLYPLSGKLIPWFAIPAIVLAVVGLYIGFFMAPTESRQGEAYRIIFIHVPAAWMSMFIYVAMCGAGFVGLVWHIKVAEIVAMASAPIGAAFTFVTLVTGSMWGKPMWGTYWVWDARLTSELVLLFLYFGVMGLHAAIDDKRTASRAAAVLALVGVVNIPIIHYSVQWWSTLHQGPTVTKFDAPSIHLSMLAPLLIMALAFKLYYASVLLLRARSEVLERERASAWVQELARGT